MKTYFTQYLSVCSIESIFLSVRQETACCRNFEVPALFGPRSGGVRKHCYINMIFLCANVDTLRDAYFLTDDCFNLS